MRRLFTEAAALSVVLAIPAFGDEFEIKKPKHRPAQTSSEQQKQQTPKQAGNQQTRGPAQRSSQPPQQTTSSRTQQQASNQQTKWTGLQVGGQGGVSGMAQGFADQETQCLRNHSLSGSPISSCPQIPFGWKDSFLPTFGASASAGYNLFQSGSMVFGLEVGISSQSDNRNSSQHVQTA
jgi:hypothetical protein